MRQTQCSNRMGSIFFLTFREPPCIPFIPAYNRHTMQEENSLALHPHPSPYHCVFEPWCFTWKPGWSQHLPHSAVAKSTWENRCEHALYSIKHTGGKNHDSETAILIYSLKASGSTHKSQNLYSGKFFLHFILFFILRSPYTKLAENICVSVLFGNCWFQTMPKSEWELGLVGLPSLGSVEMPIVLLLSCQFWAWNHLQGHFWSCRPGSATQPFPPSGSCQGAGLKSTLCSKSTQINPSVSLPFSCSLLATAQGNMLPPLGLPRHFVYTYKSPSPKCLDFL